MEWLIGGVVGAVIAVAVMLAMRRKGASEPGAKADAFFAARDAQNTEKRTA